MDTSTTQTERIQPYRLGIRGKVALILLASLLVVLTVNSLLILRAQQSDVLEETDRRGRETAQLLAQYLAYSVVSYNYHAIELILQDLIRNREVIYARVENNRGNVMAVAGTPVPPSDTIKAFQKDIRLNGELLGQLYVHLSSERVVATLEARQRDTLIGQVAAIVIVMVIGFVAISVLIIRPLSVMSSIINSNLRNGNGQIEAVPISSNDEIGDLANGFNALGQHLNETRNALESRIDLANRELQTAYRKLSVQAQELRGANRELEQLSITDPLTGLFNRRYFERLMESEVAQSIRNDTTISILLLDIDNIKAVGEQYGHGAADEALRNVAQIIGQQMRLTDVACRYSADEFFILCRRATIASAISIADALHQSLVQNPVPIQDMRIQLEVSIGVATIPGVKPVTSADQFLQHAEEALRQSKQSGAHGVVHYSMIDPTNRSILG